MLMSERTQSKALRDAWIDSIAWRPFSASTTSHPSARSTREQILRIAGSSSTASTRPRCAFTTSMSFADARPQHDLERRAELLVVPRLQEVAVHCALVDGTHHHVEIAVRRDEKPDRVGIVQAHRLEEVEPVAVGVHRVVA